MCLNPRKIRGARQLSFVIQAGMLHSGSPWGKVLGAMNGLFFPITKNISCCLPRPLDFSQRTQNWPSPPKYH